MHFRQFYLGCLAHASYLIGSGAEAAVVDPQRDIDIYLEEAKAHGFIIPARGRSKDAAGRPSHSGYAAGFTIWRRTHSRVPSDRAQWPIRLLGRESYQIRCSTASRCRRARVGTRGANAVGASRPGESFGISKGWSPCLAHGRSAKIAAVCAGGYRSSIATRLLEQLGFRNILNVVGGMSAWNNAKLALAS